MKSIRESFAINLVTFSCAHREWDFWIGKDTFIEETTERLSENPNCTHTCPDVEMKQYYMSLRRAFKVTDEIKEKILQYDSIRTL